MATGVFRPPFRLPSRPSPLGTLSKAVAGTPPTLQSAGTAVAGAAGFDVAWPAHLTDDIGLLLIETANQSVGAVSGWTAITDSPQGRGTPGAAGATMLAAFWKRAASASEGVAAIPDSGDHQIARIFTFRGCIATGSPINLEEWDGVASTTVITCPGGTTTAPDCLIVFVSTWDLDSLDPGVNGSAADPSGLASTQRRAVDGTLTGNGGGFSVWTATKAVAGVFGGLVAGHDAAAEQVHLTVALLSVAATAVTGTGSVALAPLTSEATGVVALAGTVTTTLEALTSSGAGVLPIAGVAGGTLAPLTAVATAALALAGIATSELAPLTGTATGVGQDPASVGAGDVTLAPLTSVATGTGAPSGSGSVTLAPLLGTGAGALALAAAAGSVLAPLTGSAEGVGGGGSPPIFGVLSVTLGPLTSVATGIEFSTPGAYWGATYWSPLYWGRRYWSHAPVVLAAGTGAGEVTLAPLTAATAAALALTGAVTSTLAPLTSTAAGTSGGILGVGDVTLAPLTGVATTQQGIMGVGNVTLAPLTAVGTAHVGPPARPIVVLSDETFGVPSAMYETLVIAGGP